MTTLLEKEAKLWCKLFIDWKKKKNDLDLFILIYLFMLKLFGISLPHFLKFSKFPFICFRLSQAYWFIPKKIYSLQKNWNFPLKIFLQIWSHFLKKSVMENLIFCAVTSKDHLPSLVQSFFSNRLSYHNILVTVKPDDGKPRGLEIILRGTIPNWSQSQSQSQFKSTLHIFDIINE